MSELEEWKISIHEYNERYERANVKIKEDSKKAIKLLYLKTPTTELADIMVELSTKLQRLVELHGEAGYNVRGIKNFYERTLITRKREILRGEEKVAVNVAEGQAVIDAADEFFLYNEAEMLYDTCERRYTATQVLIGSLQTKLAYGYKP